MQQAKTIRKTKKTGKAKGKAAAVSSKAKSAGVTSAAMDKENVPTGQVDRLVGFGSVLNCALMLGIIHHIAVGFPCLFARVVFGELHAALLGLTSTPQAAMWQRNSSRRGRLFSFSAQRSVGRCEKLTRTWLSQSRCCLALSLSSRTPVSSFLTAHADRPRCLDACGGLSLNKIRTDTSSSVSGLA